MSRSARGFTLIELLVVITIIAILAAIGIWTYQLALKQARDGKRQSDLKSIQSALEQYFADQFYYPADCCVTGKNMNTVLTDGTSFTNDVGQSSNLSPIKTYLNQTPQDPLPLTNPRYCYITIPSSCDNDTTTNRCTSYSLHAKLESSPSGTLSCGSSTYNLEVTRP